MAPVSFWLWLTMFYLVPASVITLLVRIIARQHNEWHKWEYGSIFLPLIVWIIATGLSIVGKSLSNAGVEPLVIGVLYGICQVGRAFHPKKAILFSIVIPVFLAVLTYLLMPSLVE